MLAVCLCSAGGCFASTALQARAGLRTRLHWGVPLLSLQVCLLHYLVLFSFCCFSAVRGSSSGAGVARWRFLCSPPSRSLPCTTLGSLALERRAGVGAGGLLQRSQKAGALSQPR